MSFQSHLRSQSSKQMSVISCRTHRVLWLYTMSVANEETNSMIPLTGTLLVSLKII